MSWENYLLEFDEATWVCIAATCLFLTAALSAALLMHNRSGGGAAALVAGTAVVTRAMLSKGSELQVRKLSVKALVLVTLLFSTVIFACYRGSMNAFLAVVKPRAIVRSLEDVLEDTSGLTYWSPTYFEPMFTESPPGSVRRTLYDNFVKDPIANVNDYDKVVVRANLSRSRTPRETEQLSQGIRNVVEDNYVLVVEEQLIRLNPHYGCHISRVPYDFHSQIWVAFVFRKDSPLVKMFNKEILRLKDQGVVDRLLGRYLNHAGGGDGRCTEQVFALGLTNVFTPFFSLCLGTLGGFALVLAEWAVGAVWLRGRTTTISHRKASKLSGDTMMDVAKIMELNMPDDLKVKALRNCLTLNENRGAS